MTGKIQYITVRSNSQSDALAWCPLTKRIKGLCVVAVESQKAPTVLQIEKKMILACED